MSVLWSKSKIFCSLPVILKHVCFLLFSRANFFACRALVWTAHCASIGESNLEGDQWLNDFVSLCHLGPSDLSTSDILCFAFTLLNRILDNPYWSFDRSGFFNIEFRPIALPLSVGQLYSGRKYIFCKIVLFFKESSFDLTIL